MEWKIIIKEIRDILCVSQTELATILGVAFISVNRWENGHFEPTIKIKRKILKLVKEYKLEDALSLSKDHIF